MITQTVAFKKMVVAIDTELHLSKILHILRIKTTGSYVDWLAHRRTF